MQRLVRGAHRYEFRATFGARLGELGRRDAVENCIPICGVEILEERACARVALQCFAEVLGYGRRSRTVVGSRPPTSTLAAFHLGNAGNLHATARDERLRLGSVRLRPWALRSPRRESL